MSKTLSSVDLKAIYPQCTHEPFCELELSQIGRKFDLVMWVGKKFDHCEEKWSTTFQQSRQKKFEIPGIPYHFMIVNNQIYYRKNGDIG